MSRPPGGTLTFVFTDIESSTRLLRELGDGYPAVLRQHDAIIRSIAEQHGGRVFGSQGDAQHLVFHEAPAAVLAALETQVALGTHDWPAGHAVRVRMGIHTGEASEDEEGFTGLALHETARIAAAGHGGQVLLSAATRELLRDRLPEGAGLTDLGEHLLKDLEQPVRIYQLDIPGSPREFPALRSLARPAARLPARLTSFVGRAEVELVVRLVGENRLVTLSGPGGTGKTRLSVEVAEAVAPRFRDGVFFVGLDAVTDPDLVASEIAVTLGLTGGPEMPLERLITYLRERRVLLVLDNLEQVVEAGPDIIRLIRECPGLTVLATSRIPLRVYGEQELPVPTLSLPAPADALEPHEALRYEAVRLFVERARAVRPDFRLDAEDLATVLDIVRRLDGLPLAIELAAARLRTLPIEALSSRLDDRLAVLTGGARDLPLRQRTLRAAIEWSYDLLDAPDGRLFCRFSVMAGGAGLYQAEQVCGPASELGRDVLDGLASLTEQSLVGLQAGVGAEPRYAMLATIREFAAEQLAGSGEGPDLRRRHAEAFVALAEEAAPHLISVDGAAWNDRLELDHDNLRAALDWAVSSDEGGLGLRLVTALWRFWQVRGHLREGDARIHAVLELPSVADQPPALQARAEGAAGGISYWRSRVPSAHRHYSAALEHARRSGDRALIAEALYDLGFTPLPDALQQLDRLRAGRPLFEEAMALYRELDDPAGIASTTWALSMAAAAEGHPGLALERAAESLALSRRLGDPFRTGWSAHQVGLALLVLDRPDEAVAVFDESLSLWVAAGDKSGIVLLLLDIAMLAGARGRVARRWQLIGAADRGGRETGTDIVNESVEFMGWNPRRTPESDEERTWFAQGAALDLEAAVGLAREELAEP